MTVSSSGSNAKASVVVMLHLCPVGDPVLFLWLLRLKSQIELIALSLANFHPLVLWHYPVVDGSLEESKPKAPLVCTVGRPMGPLVVLCQLLCLRGLDLHLSLLGLGLIHLPPAGPLEEATLPQYHNDYSQ